MYIFFYCFRLKILVELNMGLIFLFECGCDGDVCVQLNWYHFLPSLGPRRVAAVSTADYAHVSGTRTRDLGSSRQTLGIFG